MHGWGDLQPELNALSKQGRWEDMGRLIDDDVLHTIAACGSPGEVAAHIRDRVDGVSDRICVYQPGPIAVESLAEIVDALEGLSPIVVPSRTKGRLRMDRRTDA